MQLCGWSMNSRAGLQEGTIALDLSKSGGRVNSLMFEVY